MCDIYTEQYGDNATTAKYIQGTMKFGSCDPKDASASWWTDTYQNVHCRGKTR